MLAQGTLRKNGYCNDGKKSDCYQNSYGDERPHDFRIIAYYSRERSSSQANAHPNKYAKTKLQRQEPALRTKAFGNYLLQASEIIYGKSEGCSHGCGVAV